MNHATVRLDGVEIPLIGIPMSSTQEKCDGCKVEFHLQEVELLHGRFYCWECKHKTRVRDE